jgi:hypothetical protein
MQRTLSSPSPRATHRKNCRPSTGSLLLYKLCVRMLLHVSSYCYICVLILLYMCPHTPKTAGRQRVACCYMCPHSAVYVPSTGSILLYMCPHAAICVPYCYIRVLILLYVSSYIYIRVVQAEEQKNIWLCGAWCGSELGPAIYMSSY